MIKISGKPVAGWQRFALTILLFLLLIPILLPIVALSIGLLVLRHIALHVIIWSWWCPRGRDVLFVYSDSPKWHDYVEERILPPLGERAIVLNWSHRKNWRLISLSRIAFLHFGGERQFNPLAVVFRPFRRTRSFRFWQPFRDLEHGHPEALRTMEREFFDLLAVRTDDGQA